MKLLGAVVLGLLFLDSSFSQGYYSSHDDEDFYEEEPEFYEDEQEEHAWDRRQVPESWKKPSWDREESRDRPQGQWHQEEQSEPQNHLYHYEFTTQTGLGRSQKRGFKFEAKVQYQKRGSTCLLKMQDFQAWTKNQAIAESHSSDRVQLEQKQTILLSLPVKFQCRNGELRKPVFDQEDEPWSMNIKRGALNMFHVNMKAASSRRHAQLYEETVEGECQTDYSYTPFGDKSGRQTMFNVTKSVNLKNCKEKPHIHYDFPSSDSCFDASDNCHKNNIEDHLIHSMSAATFTVVGEAERATVINGNASSQYVYAPLGNREDQIVTSVRQQLRLISNQQNQKLEEPKRPRTTGSSDLKYSFEWDLAYEQASMLGRTENLQKLNQNHQFKDSVNRFVAILKSLRQKNGENGDKIGDFLNALTILRHSDDQHLKEIEAKMTTKNVKNENQIDVFFVQMLAVCGTKNCVDRLIGLIEEKRISQMVAILALKELANGQIPSEEVAKKILIMAHQNEQRQNKESTYFLRQTLWLLSGTIMHSLCSNSMHKFAVEQHSYSKQRPCSDQLKREFLNIISQHLHQKSKWEEKLIFTKTLANAGLPESLPLLEKLVKNKAPESSWLRNSALFAVRKMARRRSGFVQSLLLPIAGDSSEPTELRLSAIKILLESRPDSSILSRLLQTSIHNDEISSVLKSALNSIGNSTRICDQSLILNSKLAAQSSVFSHKNQKSKHNPRSTLNWFSLTDHEQQSSMDFEYFASYGNQSRSSPHHDHHDTLPKHLSLAFDWLKFGLYQKNLLTWGLVTTDPDSALNNAYHALMSQRFDHLRSGKLGRYIEDVWSRGFRHYEDENEDESETYQESASHEKNLHESFRALIYAQIKEQNVGFLPLDKHLLSKALNAFKSQTNSLKESLQRGREVQISGVSLHRDMLIKIPTSAGLPLSLTFRFPNVFSLNGKAKLSPGEGSDNVRSHGSIKNRKFEVDMILSLESSMILNTEIWSPIVNHGFKVENDLRLNVPLTFSMGMEPASRHGRNFHLTIPQSQSTKELIKMSIKPTNYAIKWNDYARDFRSVSMKPAHPKPSDTAQTCFEEFFSGRNVCVKKTVGKNVFALKTLEPVEFSIHFTENKAKTQQQPVEITASLIHSSADPGVRSGSGASIDKIHVISKCGQRKASLNFAKVFDPVEKVSRLHAVLSSQSDNRMSQMMCFDSEFMPVDVQRKLFVAGSSLKWGRSCESARNFLTIQINAEPSGASPDFLVHGAPASKPGGQCTAPGKCDSGKNVYKMNVNYNLPVEIRNATNKLYRMLKHMYYEKSDVAQIEVKNPQNRVYAKLEVDIDEQPSGSLIIKLPAENFTLSHIDLPSWFTPDFEEHADEKPHEKYSKPKINVSKRKDSTFSYSSTDAKRQQDYSHSNFENEYDETESEFDLPEEFENDSDDEKDFFQNRKSDEIDLGEDHYESTFERRKTDQVLKYKKNGLKESSDWLREDEGKEKEEMYEKSTKREQKKPLWGDWLKESKENRDHQRRDREESDGYGRKNKAEESYNKVCHLNENDQITTIFSKSYKFPIGQCFATLSKDCSPERRFIILVKKMTKDNNDDDYAATTKTKKDKKELFVLLRTHKIQVQKDGESSPARAKINDQPIILKQGQEFRAPGAQNIKLYHKGDQVFVEIPEFGFKVRFDGYKVDIDFSDQTAKVQCGLCGQPNDKNWPDVQKPNFADELFASYVIKDNEKCKKPSEERTQKPRKEKGYKGFEYPKDQPLPSRKIGRSEDVSSLRRQQAHSTERSPTGEDSLWRRSESKDEGEEEDTFDRRSTPRGFNNRHQQVDSGKPVPAHYVVEHDDQICISASKLPKCEGRSYPGGEQQKRHPFHCLNKREPKAREWKEVHDRDQEQRGQFGDSQANQQYFTIIIPTECIEY